MASADGSLAVAAQSRVAVLLRAPKGPEDPYYNVSEPTASVKVVSILHTQYICDDNNLFVVVYSIKPCVYSH